MRKKVEKVCVIGTGKLAIQCAIYTKEKGIPVTLFDMGQKKSVFLEKQAEAAKIPYFYEEPKKVFEKLQKEEKSLLLVSAINERILPGAVLEKENIRAINLHQALLPAHPGRNAEAWAIFEQDEKAGITWHDMTKKVDGGEILIQKEIKLDEYITAYGLFKKQIECAYEAYKEIFDLLLEGSIQGIPQQTGAKQKFHFSKDVPAEGILDLNWSGEKISAFLRAMDYAGLPVFQKPKFCYGGKVYQWKKYEIHMKKKQVVQESLMEKEEIQEISDVPEVCIRERDIIIKRDRLRIILKNYKIVED